MSNFQTEGVIDDLFVEELENDEKRTYKKIYSSSFGIKLDKEKKDLVNIITKLHNHNRNIRETFYNEKTQLLSVISELEGKLSLLKKEFSNCKFISEENIKLNEEIISMKTKINHLESKMNNNAMKLNDSLKCGFCKGGYEMKKIVDNYEESLKALIRENEYLMNENERNINHYKYEISKLISFQEKELGKRSNTPNIRKYSHSKSLSNYLSNYKDSEMNKLNTRCGVGGINIKQINNEKIRNSPINKNIPKHFQKNNENYNKLAEIVHEIRKLELDIQNNTHILKGLEVNSPQNKETNLTESYSMSIGNKSTSENYNSKRKVEIKIMEILEQQSEYLLELKKKYNEISKLY